MEVEITLLDYVKQPELIEMECLVQVLLYDLSPRETLPKSAKAVFEVDIS